MNTVHENAQIERLVRLFPRSSHQLNGLQEADAELLRLPGAEMTIALTTDSIVEEIESGLYRDPFLIGWMIVTVNASDLAAVGAEPLGLLLNETLMPELAPDFLDQLQTGIRSACACYKLPVLGGDTNFSEHLHLSATAVGTISDGRPLTRLGLTPGDLLFATGPLGVGNAYAFQYFASRMPDFAGIALASTPYQPRARLTEGAALRSHAACAMDTSDGLIPTLDQLMRFNQVGCNLDGVPEAYIHSEALCLSRNTGIPPWVFLCGPHGEFELVFGIHSADVDTAIASLRQAGATPVYLGRAVEEPGFRLNIGGNTTTLDTARIRNLFEVVNRNPSEYLRELLKLGPTTPAPIGDIVI